VRSRCVALVVSTAAVIGGVVAVFAGADPVTFGLHAVQRSALALLRGGVAAAHRFAQRPDQLGSVTRSGVAILTSQDPVQGCLLCGRQFRRPAGRVLDRPVKSVGSHIPFFGRAVTPLRSAVPAQSLSEQLVDVRALGAAVAVTVVRCRVAGVGPTVAHVGDVVTDVGGNIARVSKAVAACHHAYPPFTPCSDP